MKQFKLGQLVEFNHPDSGYMRMLTPSIDSKCMRYVIRLMGVEHCYLGVFPWSSINDQGSFYCHVDHIYPVESEGADGTAGLPARAAD